MRDVLKIDLPDWWVSMELFNLNLNGPDKFSWGGVLKFDLPDLQIDFKGEKKSRWSFN